MGGGEKNRMREWKLDYCMHEAALLLLFVFPMCQTNPLNHIHRISNSSVYCK